MDDYKNGWRYIVWVGGCDDYFTTYKKAKEHYDNWIDAGYDDVKINFIKGENYD